MTDDELKAIEARANAATPGPWGRDYDGSRTCREDVPALVAEVRRLRAESRWLKIGEVKTLAQMKAVGFTLVYLEACDEWYAAVDSVAPDESTVTKCGSFETTLARLREHLEAL